MNVKFRMPKFGQMLSGKSMLRELLMTTLGTTISIVLTFGTAAWMDQRQKEKNRRQAVLMVISDFYAYRIALQTYYDQCFMKWKSEIEELNSIPRDSMMHLTDEEIQKYWYALSQKNHVPRDKTAENIFTSDISTWRDVENFRFIKQVGSGYQLINTIEETIKKEMDDRGATNRYFFANYGEMDGASAFVTYYELKEVQHCSFEYRVTFCPSIEYYIEHLKTIEDECMNMMNVSDKELDEFMETDGGGFAIK